MAINAFCDTLNNSNLHNFLLNCDSVNLPKQLSNSHRFPTYVGCTLYWFFKFKLGTFYRNTRYKFPVLRRYHSSCCFRIESFLSLKHVSSKNEIPFVGENSSLVPVSNRICALLLTLQNFQHWFDNVSSHPSLGKRHEEMGNTDNQIFLELWKGNLGSALKIAKEKEYLSETLVAMSVLGM